MAEAGDLLSGLDAIVDQVGEGEQRLRAYLGSLSERLARICSRAGIYCAGDTVRLEECGDDEWMFGYLFCNAEGLGLGSAFSGDTGLLGAGRGGELLDRGCEGLSRSVAASDLRAGSRRGLAGKAARSLVGRGTRNWGRRSGALDKLTLPPSAVAAGGFEKVAEDLGFGEIVADWRKAQVKAVTEPETAVRMACVIVESVCKHIIDDSGRGVTIRKRTCRGCSRRRGRS